MKSNRPIARLLGAVFSFLTLSMIVGAVLVLFADEIIPPEWNPNVALQINDPINPVTRWKLQVALSDPEICLAVLETGGEFDILPDHEDSAQCHIRTQVKLRRAGDATLTPVNTRCQTALRTALWMHHGIQPAAQEFLGQGVSQLHHLSSYNCRPIRTSAGTSTRMSTHATAEAIDITGVTLQDGQKITLLAGWNGPDPAVRAFLRDIQKSACIWFKTTLGPEYNRLHADHFHLQHTGWGTCR